MSSAAFIVELVGILKVLGHDSALVGGLAVSVRARERFTRDIDLAVAVTSDAESEALAFSMRRRGFVLRTVVEQEEKGVVATLRFIAPDGSRVDLLCASCGIEREIAGTATPQPVGPDAVVPVARIPHLIAMKVLAVSEKRDQDAADLRALLAAASAAEIRESREALRLIADRGFNRGKDLEQEFRVYLDKRS